MEQEFEVSRYKLLYIEWINSKVLLHNTGNYIQYSVINSNRKNMKNNYTYIHIYIYINIYIYFLVAQQERIWGCNAEDSGTLFWEGPLEKEMATHSSILAQEIAMDRGAW